MTTDIAERDKLILHLREKIVQYESQSTILEERLKNEIESSLLSKYEQQRKEFEQTVLSESRSSEALKQQILLEREDLLQALHLLFLFH
jgi:hypothetical protein